MKIFYSTFILFISLSFLCLHKCAAQIRPDSSALRVDSAQIVDPAIHPKTSFTISSLLLQNKFLNLSTPVSLATKQKKQSGKESLFYILAVTILLLAIFKVFYAKYFNNMFRAFFNTSLRQSQLADILLQAKLPSLIFNIFFVISFGLYAWFLISIYSPSHNNNYFFAGLSILFMAAIYAGKYICLKFIGWVCGVSEASDQYIFVIFLINKIAGIFLLPFIVLLAFAPAYWLNIIIISSLFILAVLFLMRYLRAYGSLQNKLKFNRFHFLLYIAAAEFLPVLIIYKLFVRIIQ